MTEELKRPTNFEVIRADFEECFEDLGNKPPDASVHLDEQDGMYEAWAEFPYPHFRSKDTSCWTTAPNYASAIRNLFFKSKDLLKEAERLTAELAAEKEKIAEAIELVDEFLGEWVNVEIPFLPADKMPFRDIKNFLEGNL